MYYSGSLRKVVGISLLVLVFGLTFAIVGCAPAAGVTGAPEPTITQPAATIVVTPTVVAPGETFEVAGSGFAPGERLSVKIVGATPLEDSHLGGGLVTTAAGAFYAPCLGKSEFKAYTAKYHFELGTAPNVLQLPSLKQGVYTVEASGLGGSLATAPLVVMEAAGE